MFQITKPHTVRDGFTIAMNEMAHSVGGSVQGKSTAIFASGLVKCFRESTIQMFMMIMREVVAESGSNIPGRKVLLTFLNPDTCCGYIQTVVTVNVSKRINQKTRK